MKKLLLSLTLLPLILCAAQPAKKVYGPQECYQKWQEFKTRWANRAQHEVTNFCDSATRWGQEIGLERNELINKVLKIRYNSQDSIVGRANDLGATPIIANQALVSITKEFCDFCTNSLIVRLDIYSPNLNEESKERLRKAWATPTEVFPKGRNPKNLILPEAKK